jgi:hypothetical protein
MNKQETINVVDFNNMFFSNQTEDNSRDEFNVDTFFADEDLERVFEFYDRRRPREQKTLTKKDMIPSRSYHEGRIYGSGHYGNEEKEERYQAWVKNFDLVQSSIYEYNESLNHPEVSTDEKPAWDLPKEDDNYTFKDINDEIDEIESRLDFPTNMYSYMYDTIRFPDIESDDDDEEIVEPRVVMRIVPRPTPLEEGEIVEDDVYPNDLLEPEPFIRAPVISAESAEIMADEFAECYDEEEPYDEEDYYDEEEHYDKEDPYDAILERTQDPHVALSEWEESDWVRDHPDPMISRIYVQATDRRYR